MKKIAIFQTDLNIGGIEKSLVNLLNTIDTKENKVDLYLFDSEYMIYKNDINEKINVKFLKRLPSICKFLPINIVKLFYKSEVEDEYDIAIDFNSYSPDTALAAIKTKSKRKVIWIHNDIKIKLKEEWKYKVLHFFFKGKYKYFNEFVAVSKGALDSFKEVHNLKYKRYKVIPNIIDTKEIKSKKNEPCNIRVRNDVVNLVSCGRLVHQKGFDILINEFYEVIKENEFYHLYIIGDGPLKDELNMQIKNLNLSKYVTILGYKKNPFNIMNMMDAFILTSRYEGQGMVFKEAECLGLDIILPSNLSKYVDGIKPSSNIHKDILKLKKHKNKYNDLKEYNESIITEFNKL